MRNYVQKKRLLLHYLEFEPNLRISRFMSTIKNKLITVCMCTDVKLFTDGLEKLIIRDLEISTKYSVFPHS